MKIPSLALLLLSHRAYAGSINARGSPVGNGRGGREAPVDTSTAGELKAENSMTVTPLTGRRPRSFHRVDRGGAANPGGFYGESDERDGSTINLVPCGSSDGKAKVCGTMNDITDGTVYHFRHDERGEPRVTETPYDAFPPDAEPEVEDLGEEPEQPGGGTPGAPARSLLRAPRGLQAADPVMDVLVPWSPGAECRVSGLSAGCTLTATTEANMRAEIDVAFVETNAAYAASGINAQIRLAHAYRVEGYDEADMGTYSSSYHAALYRMQGLTDGYMDDIHGTSGLRATHGADIVAMVINGPEYCGLGFRPTSHASAQNSMFSVSNWSCFTGYYTWGHEIGHNQGMHHDRGTVGACDPNDTDGRYGYRHPNANWRTILAYTCTSTTQCDGIGTGGCGKIQRFSSSTLTYNGEPFGSPGGPGTLGRIDNASQLNAVASLIEDYYPAVAACVIDADCDDQDPCSVDSCSGGTCTNAPMDCNDSNACTDDTCSNGVCSNAPIACDDGQACTADACDPASGCQHVPDDGLCAAGYECLASQGCTDVNECLASPCSGPNEDCANAAGSYTCDCQSGYERVDGICADIDECLSSPCDANASCANAPGSYGCTCNAGYVGDGETCTACLQGGEGLGCDAATPCCSGVGDCTGGNPARRTCVEGGGGTSPTPCPAPPAGGGCTANCQCSSNQCKGNGTCK